MSFTLQSENAEIVYRNLSLKNKTRPIFKNIDGKICARRMVALLGPSGAGKTSFLNAIAGRLPRNLELSGEILVNGEKRNQKEWTQMIGYVEQDFFAYEKQTVSETFEIYAKLKFGRTDHLLVNELMTVLNLGLVADSRICELSGGERKRVSIGAELIGNPNILFLDEPISGLDSFNAINILSTLSRLKDFGKTILVTIHQPSTKMLNFFDSIILMGNGGIVFDGPFSECVDFFEENGFKCPKFTNPSDFFLDTISVNSISEEAKANSLKNLELLSAAWKRRQTNHECELKEGLRIKVRGVNRLSFFSLFNRNFQNTLRDDAFLKLQLIQKTVFMVLIGLTFLQLGTSQQAVLSRIGVINFLILQSLFGVAGPIFNIFAIEKKIINRERKSGCYDGYSAYYAKYLSELPYVIVFNLAYVSGVYWIVGLNNNAGHFFIYLIIVAALVCFSVAFAFTISAIASTQQNAQVLGTTIIIVFVLYGGLFANPETIKPWLRWIIWISPVNYAFRASMIVLIANLQFDESSGDDVIARYGADGVNAVSCVFLILGYTLLCSALGATVLHKTTMVNIMLEDGKDK